MDIYFIPFFLASVNWIHLFYNSQLHYIHLFKFRRRKQNCTMSNVYIYIGIIIIILKKRDRLYKLRRLWQKKTHPRASSSGNSCNTIWVKQIKSPKSGNKEKEIRQIPTLKLWTVYDSRRGSFRQIKPLLWFICNEVNTILIWHYKTSPLCYTMSVKACNPELFHYRDKLPLMIAIFRSLSLSLEMSFLIAFYFFIAHISS